MSDTTITASPAVLHIDVGAGVRTGTSTIEYKSIYPVTMWQRLNLSFWTPVNLFSIVGTAEADTVGSFSTDALRPGDLVEYRAYIDDGANPNGPRNDRARFEQAQVQALVKDPTRQDWITDQSTETGGTYYGRLLATGPLITTVHAEISPAPPSTGVFGELIFADVLASADSALRSVHTFELKPLLAGTGYFCTIRLSDQQGNWFYLQENPVTLQRTVTVDFDSVFVNNDGDGGGTGEAEIWITSFEGDSQVDQIHFGDDEYDVLTGAAVLLGNQLVLGPKPVSAATHDIGINAAGIEYDGFLESDEHADTWGHPPNLRRQLDFPAGSAVEKLTNHAFAVSAVPGSVGDHFAFTVKGHYSVDYT